MTVKIKNQNGSAQIVEKKDLNLTGYAYSSMPSAFSGTACIYIGPIKATMHLSLTTTAAMSKGAMSTIGSLPSTAQNLYVARCSEATGLGKFEITTDHNLVFYPNQALSSGTTLQCDFDYFLTEDCRFAGGGGS